MTCPSSRRRTTDRVNVKLVRLEDGKVVVDREVFRCDVTLGSEARAVGRSPIPFSNHYAPGTKQNLRANTAVPRGLPGQGRALVSPLRASAQPLLGHDDGQERPVSPDRQGWDVASSRADASVDALVQNLDQLAIRKRSSRLAVRLPRLRSA